MGFGVSTFALSSYVATKLRCAARQARSPIASRDGAVGLNTPFREVTVYLIIHACLQSLLSWFWFCCSAAAASSTADGANLISLCALISADGWLLLVFCGVTLFPRPAALTKCGQTQIRTGPAGAAIVVYERPTPPISGRNETCNKWSSGFVCPRKPSRMSSAAIKPMTARMIMAADTAWANSGKWTGFV